MDRSMLISPTVLPPIEDPGQRHEHRLELLIEWLPTSLRRSVRWLRRPSSRWLRIPAGGLLVVGGVFSILPFLGLWMLPLGLALLAEDMPILRRARGRVLDWMAVRRPHWLARQESAPTAQLSSRPQDASATQNEK